MNAASKSIELRMCIEILLEPQRMVMARLIDYPESNFQLSDDVALGGVPIHPVLSRPRALQADGEPRLDLYAFRMRVWSDSLRVGQEVLLTGVQYVDIAPPLI